MNQRQTKFLTEYLKCGNATQAAVASGYSKRTAGQQGFMLLKNPEIAAAVKQAQGEAMDSAGITLESHLRKLEELCDRAALAKQFGPAVSAETQRGKVAGFHVERLDVNLSNLSDEELAAIAAGKAPK